MTATIASMQSAIQAVKAALPYLHNGLLPSKTGASPSCVFAAVANERWENVRAGIFKTYASVQNPPGVVNLGSITGSIRAREWLRSG